MIGGAVDSKTLTYRVADAAIVGNSRFSIASPKERIPDATAGLTPYPHTVRTSLLSFIGFDP
jgi:hypothetical protein